MKPLPLQNSGMVSANDSAIPSVLYNPSGPYSLANRSLSTYPLQRIYPWLLSISVVVAALFCFMYITKPVIITPQVPFPSVAASRILPERSAPDTVPAKSAGMLPQNDRLPGEKGNALPATNPSKETVALSPPPTTSDSPFEKTNLRIQHILTAEAPGGHLAKIDLDVPVLYQSRNCRWTLAEVTEARALLTRLSDYQEKSRTLREEGSALLESWNLLIERSIPTGALRADSPSLPINQQDAAGAPRSAGLNTTESIKILPAGQ